MHAEINGKEYDTVPDNCTLDQLLQFFDIDSRRVVVEIDGSIVQSSGFETVNVQPGSRVEIIHFVGGG